MFAPIAVMVDISENRRSLAIFPVFDHELGHYSRHLLKVVEAAEVLAVCGSRVARLWLYTMPVIKLLT